MELQEAVSQFLFHCRYEKNLSPKTLKAYSIDLRQFLEHLAAELQIATLEAVDKVALRAYIKSLFGPLKEKSVKRKVATLKALFHFLEREDAIVADRQNPDAADINPPMSPAQPLPELDLAPRDFREKAARPQPLFPNRYLAAALALSVSSWRWSKGDRSIPSDSGRC